MKLNRKFLLIGILLIAATAFAAKFSENILIIGKGLVSEDTTIVSNQPGSSDPYHKYDSAQQRWVFSNDGVNEKSIGSGSGGGGGVNLLADDNPDFEAGLNGWTASGGAFVAETAAPLFGEQSGAWTSNLSNQTLDTALKPITLGFVGAKCQLELKYIYPSGTNGDYEIQVRQFDDSAASEITVATLPLEVTASKKTAQLFFDCPDDAADTLRLRVESTIPAPSQITIDDAFLGTGRNSFSISQTEIIGSINYASNANCIWTGDSDHFSNFDDYSVDVDCDSPTLEGIGKEPIAGKVPGILFDRLPPGKYEISVNLHSFEQSGATGCYHLISDGTLQSGFVNTFGNTTDRQNRLVGTFEYATEQTNVFFRVQSRRFSGSGNCQVRAGSSGFVTTSPGFRMQVKKFPSVNSEAITLETSGSFWQGYNTTTSGQWDMATSGTDLVFSGIERSTGVLVVEPNSAPMQQACAGTEEASSTTCSGGDESVGVSIFAPTAGSYEVCVEATLLTRTDASDGIDVNFKIVQTENGSQTILQEPDRSVKFRQTNNSASVDIRSQVVNMCHVFSLGTAGKKTFRVFEAHNHSGSPVAINFQSNTTLATGPKWTIKNITNQFPTPVFTDLVESFKSKLGIPGESDVDVYIQNASCSTGSIPGVSMGDHIFDSISNLSSGNCSVTINPAITSDKLFCFLSPISNSTNAVSFSLALSSTNAGTIHCRAGTGSCATGGSFSAICIGNK